MNQHALKLISQSTLALAVAAFSLAANAQTVSQDILEARQESQIWTSYALNPYLEATDIAVVVDNGKATLSGTVAEDISRDLAKEIAAGVDGIKSVDNQIVVKTDYVAPARTSSDRTFAEMTKDSTISTSVKSKLLWSRYTDGLTTKVESRSGKVTLTGSADSAAARELAGVLALNTQGVVAIDNQLVVIAPSGNTSTVKEAGQQAGEAVSDSWITTKVKMTYAHSSNVDGSDISVKTNDGIVTLGGAMSSGAEKALAIELARNVRGVRNVDSSALTL